MDLIEDLGPGPIGVDTALFIYLIEADPKYLPVIAPLFSAADDGTRDLVTSALTLLEVLVVPYRAGDLSLAARYEALLTRSRGVRIVELSMEHLRAAAQLRAAIRIRTPDALQIVAALRTGCTTFVTNDRGISGIPGLRILQLSDYLR